MIDATHCVFAANYSQLNLILSLNHPCDRVRFDSRLETTPTTPQNEIENSISEQISIYKYIAGSTDKVMSFRTQFVFFFYLRIPSGFAHWTPLTALTLCIEIEHRSESRLRLVCCPQIYCRARAHFDNNKIVIKYQVELSQVHNGMRQQHIAQIISNSDNRHRHRIKFVGVSLMWNEMENAKTTTTTTTTTAPTTD